MDLKTLYIVLGLTDTLQAISFYVQYLVNKKQKGVAQWTVGFSLVAIGFSLIIFRQPINNKFLTILLANACLNMGAIYIYIGIMRFLDSKENRFIIYFLMTLFVLSFTYYTFFQNDINDRTMITSCIVATVSFFTAHGLFTKKTKAVRTTANFLGTVFLLHGLFYLVRTIINLTVSPVHVLFGSTPIQIYTFLVQITEGILITMGLIIMVNQKSYSDSEEDKEHFKLIFNTSPDAAIISSIEDGKIIEVNQAFMDLTGYSMDELTGESTLSIHIWKNPKDRQKVVDTLKQTGICQNFEALYLRKDGREVYGNLTAKIINLKGKPHIISITRDVTESKKSENALHETNEFLNNLITYANAPIIIWDPFFKIVRFNKAFERLTGRTEQDVIGQNVSILFPQDLKEAYLKLLQNTQSGERWETVEIKILHVDGTLYDILWNSATIFDKKNHSIIATIAQGQNITELKLVQQDLKKLNEELEQKVIYRTMELENSNKELEEFAYSISHDLRAPLRAIDGFSKILLEKMENTLDSEENRMFSIIRANTSKMDKLILDLLSMAKITRSKLNMEPLLMNQMVKNVLAGYHFSIEQNHIHLTVNEIPDTWGDQELIRQVWENLLENAIKFTKPKDYREIVIKGMEENDRVVYSVMDNGIGFNPEYANKLFKPFYTLHSLEEFESVGIGLAMVERIIHRHSGQVWAEGAEGKGATFYFSLPQHP